MGEKETSISETLAKSAERINALDDKWISDWAELAEKHYKLEQDEAIRAKVIDSIRLIFNKYHVIYGEELMNKVILPSFNDVDQETSSPLRRSLIHLLNDLASNCISYKHCNAVLAILRRMLTRPFKQRGEELANGIIYIFSNRELVDSRSIVANLNRLFMAKLNRLPIDPAVNILDILVSYLNLTFKHPLQGPAPAELPLIRKEIFLMLLNLRCNRHGHLGVMDHEPYSPFIICVKRPRSPDAINHQHQAPSSPGFESPMQTSYPMPMSTNHQPTLPPTTSQNHSNQPPTQAATASLLQHPHGHNIFLPNALYPNCPIESRCVDLDPLFSGIIECLNQETDIDTLETVLKGLPGLLANKPLVTTVADERVNQLCLSLCNLIISNRNANNRQTVKTDYAKYGLRCLTSLLIYRRLLDHKSIKMILSVFEESIKSVSRHPIVTLFTTCLIELRDGSEMTKFVPIVLDHLRRFSPTIVLGPSILEFLSYLILFPKLYENFSQDEYKFIFSIALPYTNPFRFSDYITCLAFRVIAMWYLNCRPSLRCAFVEQVRKSLQSNVIQPFKENTVPSQPALHSQTSSPIIAQTPPITYSCPATMSPVDQRKRSSSLNAENCYRQHGFLSGQNQQSSLQLNEELMETFADLLSRYTHGQYLAIAPKNRCTEMLIDRSKSQTWLNGNSLVTITAGQSNNGWAEIMIRRPTGNTCWVGRLQNTVGALSMFNQQVYTDALNFGNDIISLFSSLSLTSDDGGEMSDSLNTLSSAISSISSTLSHSSSSTIQPDSNNHQQQANQIRIRDPIPLPKDKKFDIAMSNFDLITPYETHKVGVVFVGPKQANDRAAILSNKFGSQRYHEFLGQIGTCIILNDIDPEIYFVGGLDVKGDDGKYAYFWKDNVTQVIFHVATFMLNRENDPQCNYKNRHIGNDHVCIVYNESGEPFKLSTIKGTGQLLKTCVIIVPLEDDTNMVEVEVLPELKNIVGDIETRVLTNLGASLYARQMAIHLNLASKIFERRQCEGFFSKEPYVSNWVERLRCIKRIRHRLDEHRRSTSNNGAVATRGSNTLR